ncbi:MAG: LEA type 2 family protein [Bacteroidetes bacterium]|nr:LEA type 2 family protein [Bacteroidota bacterium]
MKKLLKIFLIILFILLGIIAGLFTWRFVNYKLDKNPDKTFLLPYVEIAQVEIASHTPERTELIVNMRIVNHLPGSFTVDSLQYSVFIDGEKVVKNTYKRSVTFKHGDSSRIELPVTISTDELKAIIKANDKKGIDSVEYQLQVSFYTDLIFKKKFGFNFKKVLPLYYFLEASAEHIRIDSLNFSRAAIQLIVSVKNKNVFPIRFSEVSYKFAIEDHKWLEGRIPGLTVIKANSVTEISIPIRISFREVGKTLFDLLKNGSKVNYKLWIAFVIESEKNILSNSKVILNSSGSVKSLLKSVQK